MAVLRFSFIYFSLAFFANPASAIDIGIQEAMAPAVGLSFVQYGYNSSERGSFYKDGKVLSDATEYNTTRQHIRLVRTFDWNGRTSAFHVQLPHLKIETDNVALSPMFRANDAGAGFGDLTLLLATWLHNDRKNGHYLSVGSYLFLPTGNYDVNNTKVVNTNPGGNRYRAALQVAHHLQVTEKTGWMMAFDTVWSSKNPEAYMFSPTPTVYRQAPLYSFQTALSYRLSPRHIVGTGYFYSAGGESSLGSVKQNDATRTQRFQLTSNFFALPTMRLTLQYGADLKVDNGFKEKQHINFSITQIF